MNCEEARSEMVAVELGQADGLPASELADHLKACEGCRSEAGGIKTSLALLRGQALEFKIDPGLRGRVLASLDGAAAPESAQKLPLRRRGLSASHLAIFASAAVLVLSAAMLHLLSLSSEPKPRGLVVLGRVLSADSGGVQGPLLADVSAGGQQALDLPCRVLIRDPARIDLPGGVSVTAADAGMLLEAGGVRLDQGRMVVSLQPGHPFRVETRAARIDVTGTVFQVSVTGAGGAAEATTVSVERGSVLVSAGSAGSLEARPGLSVSSSGGRLFAVDAAADPLLCALAVSRDLALQAGASGGPAGGTVAFTLLNISPAPIKLPPPGTDRPRFSLKFRDSGTGFEGVANLGSRNPLIRGRSGERIAEAGAPMVLEPGESLELSFDVSGALSGSGDFEAWGIYQSIPPAAPGVWIGQAVSGPFTMRKLPVKDR